MNNATLGICIALMIASLTVGGTLAYSSANAITVKGGQGGVGGNGVHGGLVHENGTGTDLTGLNGTNANGVGGSSR